LVIVESAAAVAFRRANFAGAEQQFSADAVGQAARAVVQPVVTDGAAQVDQNQNRLVAMLAQVGVEGAVAGFDVDQVADAQGNLFVA
jgi:hypothetical protein